MMISAYGPSHLYPVGTGCVPMIGHSSSRSRKEFHIPAAVARKRRARKGPQVDSLGWAQKQVNKQRRERRNLNYKIDGLRYQLLNLDLEADGRETLSERIGSNARASTSTNTNTALKKRSPNTGLGKVPVSPEVLVAQLRQLQEKATLLSELDLESPRAVASRLLQLSSLLALPPAQLLPMANMCRHLLVRQPRELQASLSALAACLAGLLRDSAPPSLSPSPSEVTSGDARAGGPSSASAGGSRLSTHRRSGGGSGGRDGSGVGSAQQAAAEALMAQAQWLAREMAVQAPHLLLLPPAMLLRRGMELGLVCGARGFQVVPLLAKEPDLLLQRATRLAAKLDVLPGTLGLPPRRVREVLEACPQLLKRSPLEMAQCSQLLQDLFRVPPAFMAELILQEPRVLSFGADSLRAKFKWLAARYGRSQEDVADMILVDPSVLVKAAAPAAPVASGGDGSDATSTVGPSFPVLERMLQLSAVTGILAGSVLELVLQDDQILKLGPSQAAARMALLQRVFGLPTPSPVVAAAMLPAPLPGAGRGASAVPYGNDSAAREERQKERDGKDEDVRQVLPGIVSAHPRLLLLTKEQMLARRDNLAALLRLPAGATDAEARSAGVAGRGAGVRGNVAASGPAVSAVLGQLPELLLEDPRELQSRLAHLTALLTGTSPQPSETLPAEPSPAATPGAASPAAAVAPVVPLSVPSAPPRVLSVVRSQPGLLAAPLGEVSNRVLVMQSLFEIPRALVLELVAKEPGLLAVSVDGLERKFKALAAAFGAFSSDAIDVVLADPSLVLQADADATLMAPTVPTAAQPSPSAAGGDGSCAAARWTTRGRSGSRTGSRARRAPDGQRDGAGGAPTAGAEVSAAGHGRPAGGRSTSAAAAGGAPASGRWDGAWADGAGGRDEPSGGDWAGRLGSMSAAEFAALGPAGADGAGKGAGADGSAGAGSRAVGELGAMSAAEFDALGSGDGELRGGNSSSSGGGDGGSGDGRATMGALGAMSAADFDKLGSEGLPPPPPPPSRRRRRQV